MSEEKATDVGPSGIEVADERIGDPLAPPVLLASATSSARPWAR